MVELGQKRAQAVLILRTVLEAPLDRKDSLASSLVGPGPLDHMRVDPGSVIRFSHRKLHSYYPFSEVPTCWRRCFEEACLWQVLMLLHRCDRGTSTTPKQTLSGKNSPNGESMVKPEIEDEIIRLCDDAIIIAGAPGRRHIIDLILDSVDNASQDDLPACLNPEDIDAPADASRTARREGYEACAAAMRSAKCPRLMAVDSPTTPVHSSIPIPRSPSAMPSIFATLPSSVLLSFKQQLVYHVIRRLAPTLSEFEQHLAAPNLSPLIIEDGLAHWPAISRWKNPRYWLHRTNGGHRRVPVEWGRSYVDEGWGQSIVPFGDFLRDELLGMKNTRRNDASKTKSAPGTIDLAPVADKKKRKGYLAQHDMLGQIPTLRNDIAVPDYCYCSTKSFTQAVNSGPDDEDEQESDDMTDPALNIWLGPAGTVSPAHTDPHHNLLAQVFGRKYVRLFSPDMDPHMYPLSGSPHSSTSADEADAGRSSNGGYSMSNTSSVDVGLEIPMFSASSLLKPVPNFPDADATEHRLLQRKRYPNFHTSARYVECILEPGELLFIPRGWWHYVRSLEVSCNVSFWWD